MFYFYSIGVVIYLWYEKYYYYSMFIIIYSIWGKR